MKKSRRKGITRSDVAVLLGTLASTRKARGDHEGASRAQWGRYAVRLADILDTERQLTQEQRQKLAAKLKRPAR